MTKKRKSFGDYLKKKVPFLFKEIHVSHLIYPLVPSLPTKKKSLLSLPRLRSVIRRRKRKHTRSKHTIATPRVSLPVAPETSEENGQLSFGFFSEEKSLLESADIPAEKQKGAIKQLFDFLNSPLPQLFKDLTDRMRKVESAVQSLPKTPAAPVQSAVAESPKTLEADSRLKSAKKEEPVGSADALLNELGTIKKSLPDATLMQGPAVADLPKAEVIEETKAEQAEREKKEKEANAKFESKDEEKPIRQAQDKKEEAKPEVPVAKAVVDEPLKKIKLQRAGSQGFSAFIASIKYIGLREERLRIIQSLGTMLSAGLSLVDSLKALRMETRTKPVKKLLGRIIDAVENGSPLWRAFDNEKFFSPHALSLIRIGEEAGNLAKNMEYLALQQEKDEQLRSKVKMAMIYPVIVLTLMFIIVIGLGMFVLPNLIPVLYSLNVELPLVTRMLIAFTEAFTTYGHIAVPGSIAGFLLIIILGKFTPLRIVTQWLMFHIPGIGQLAREATIARFGVIMGGLLQAGVPLVEAIHSLAEVTPIVRYRSFYKKLLEHVTVGDSFAKSFAAIPGSPKVLPISVQQLIMTGERSGSLSKIFLKISDIYEKKANETAQKLPVILEPMLLLFIGALVGTIAFAIIVPIYSIVGNVGRS